MSRTKLRQVVQVNNSESYSDSVTNANTLAVAQPAISQGYSIEHDLNILRSLTKQLKGSPTWYSAPANTINNLNSGTGLNGTSAASYTSVLNYTQGSTFVNAISALDSYMGDILHGFTDANIQAMKTTSTVETALLALDGYAAATQGELDKTQTTLGSAVNVNGTFQGFTSSSPVNIAGSATSFTQAIQNLADGYNNLLSTTSSSTLQVAYNQGVGATPDIQVSPNDTLDFVLGSGNSTFNVKSNDGNASFRVGNDFVTMLNSTAGSQTLTVTDGYVLIDGYLAVTGNTVVLDSVVTDADHLILTPSANNTVALKVQPTVTESDYVANILELWTGSNAGSAVVRVDHDGKVHFFGGNKSFQYVDSLQQNGYYLRSDSSGYASWSSVADDLAGSGLSSTGTTLNVNVVANETKISTDAIGLDPSFSKTDFTQFTVASSGQAKIESVSDGYVGSSTKELYLKDGKSNPTSASNKYFRLSSSSSGGADFLPQLRVAASAFNYLSSGSSGELGLVDAINATFLGSGGATFKKAVYILGTGDTRLSASNGSFTSNVLSLNGGTGPTRGSVSFTSPTDGYGLNFHPGHDVKVFVNGVLQLADSTQKATTSSPTDDFFLSSSDYDKLVFAFNLVPGDVVVVENTNVAAGAVYSSNWLPVV